MQREGNISSCFGACREAINMRDSDRNEGYEIRMKIESLKLGLSFFWQEERDSVASLCKLV
jgi:hypothetical protein